MSALIVEIFTQQRNNSPRKRNGGRSPEDTADGAKRPEHMRSTLEQLKRRFEKQLADAGSRWDLIAAARKHFGDLDEESTTKMKKMLLSYPITDIMGAQAAYLAQIATHPYKKYRSEYFFAILRYKREEKAKQTYSEAFRAGIDLYANLDFGGSLSEEVLSGKILELLEGLNEEPTPSHRLMKLNTLSLWLFQYSHKGEVSSLWTKVEKLAHMSIAISMRRCGTRRGTRRGTRYKDPLCVPKADSIYCPSSQMSTKLSHYQFRLKFLAHDRVSRGKL
jgi:hypothetical protein